MDGTLSGPALTGPARAVARVQGLVLRGALGVPPPLRRLATGAPVRRDGQTLEPEVQLMLRAQALARPPALRDLTPAQARRRVAADAYAVSGRPVRVAAVREITVASGVRARLYVPEDLAGAGLLVYFHGGGFVVGDPDVYDPAVRRLAVASGVRVLSVDYRLAPEHPFPAAAEDAWAAWHGAVARAGELGADPARVAVGGDSAGGNLAAGVAVRAAGEGGPAPRAQLLIYPWLDLCERHPSRLSFADGYYLTDDDLVWYADHYLGGAGGAGGAGVADGAGVSADPRASPLRAASVAGVAPAYIATAGFDPLRDEGEAYAGRLRAAGVPVVLRREPGLVHGHFNATAVLPGARRALFHLAGALALALA